MRIVVATLVFLVSIPLFATPSTLVAIPSTDIQPQGVWHLGVDSFIFTGGADAPAPFVDAGLTYGVTPRVELGVDVISGTNNPIWLNGKVQLLSPEDYPIALSVGVFNAATSDATNQQVVYAVGSRKIGDARVTLGGFTANDDLFGNEDTGVMAGVEYTRGQWWYAADYVSGDNPLGSWNVGIGYTLAENVGVIFGYDNYNAPGAADSFNIQFDVNL